MKDRVFISGIVIGLMIAAVAVIGAVFAWQKFSPAFSSPEENFILRDISWKLDQKLFVISSAALAISFIAGFLGYKTYNDLDKVVKEKVNSVLEKELYQLDPTNLPIHLYNGRIDRTQSKARDGTRTTARDEMKKVAERLSLTGLQNVGNINRFDKVSGQGITIIPIDSTEDEKEFVKFVGNKQSELDHKKAGFILYAPDGYRVDKKTLDAFPNVVTANMPPTVANMVLVIGRGLKNREE